AHGIHEDGNRALCTSSRPRCEKLLPAWTSRGDGRSDHGYRLNIPLLCEEGNVLIPALVEWLNELPTEERPDRRSGTTRRASKRIGDYTDSEESGIHPIAWDCGASGYRGCIFCASQPGAAARRCRRIGSPA